MMDESKAKKFIEQEEKIKKYERRMRDLVESYKSLQKEKEVLEATVKTLTSKNEINSASNDSNDSERVNDQLLTLTNTISTLTEEKRRMEKSYLTDKKVTREEYEKNLATLRKELESQNIVIRELNGQLSQLRMEEKKFAGKADELSETQTRCTDLMDDLLKKDLIIKKLEMENDRLCAARDGLEQEMIVTKLDHEARVTHLEESITELSDSIGLLEQQHLSDQDTITKLSERIKSLCETKHLLKRDSINQQPDTPDILQFQDSEKISTENTIQNIVERMSKLRQELQLLDPNLDIISVISGSFMNGKPEFCSGACKSEINQLKEKLECCQLKIESLLKTKSCTNSNTFHQQEIDKLNKELIMTKTKISHLQDELSNLDTISSRTQKTLKDTIMKNEWAHKQEINKLKQQHSQAVTDLQTELTKHRNRTINLLSEKDLEIQNLQRILQLNSTSSKGSDVESDCFVDKYTVDLSDFLPAADFSCPLYQCCEVKARMELELKKLRQQKRDLQLNIHKLEAEVEYVRSDWSNEVQLLTDKLHKAESISKLGNSMNMEYLRNVFTSFLKSNDPSSKYLMAKAIGKMLQFSAEEIEHLKSDCSL